MNQSWIYIEYLLRDRSALFQAIDREEAPLAIMRGMLLTIFVGAAVFGASIGSYRGGIQIVYAAIKFPLVLLGTAAICAPVLTCLEMALGNEARWRRDLVLMGSSIAIGALSLIALAPLIVLADVFELDYHRFILLIGLCFALAGTIALITLRGGITTLARSFAVGRTLALVAVLAVVGLQMSWTLRPYVLRPRAESVPFVRSLDGSLVEAFVISLQSAGGTYSRQQAPLPEGS